MVCCQTLKLWADWLLEVAQNTHKWSCWIRSVICQVRLIARILKGEIKNCDGSRRTLYKEEWEFFKTQLDRDIIQFGDYNVRVRELSDRMIEQYGGKHVTCCPACLSSRLIVSIDQAHSVITTLADAIKMSEYWRNHLEKLVDQAKRVNMLPSGNNLFYLPKFSSRIRSEAGEAAAFLF